VERDLIRTRTAEGRSRAQKRGQQMGRPPRLTRRAGRPRPAGDGRRVLHLPNLPAATTWARARFRDCDDEAPVSLDLASPAQQRPHSVSQKVIHEMHREAILDRYRALMEEIKWRSAIIETAHTLPFPRAGAAIELSYLQLRMICEVLAVGCLLVHGDVPASRAAKLKKEYKADLIIKTLERLHSDFYPVPCEIKYDLNNHPWHVVEPTTIMSILDKQSLQSLYYEAGYFLHRGTLEFVSSAKIRKVRLETIQGWVTKIKQLLHNHRIQLIGGEHELWIDMQGPKGFAALYAMRRTERTMMVFC
jgi:hypothetical protein